MAIGDLITATRFNTLRSRIDAIHGVGSGQTGYGQALESATVATNEIVSADDMSKLFTDIVRARTHQTGVVPTAIGDIAIGDIVGEFAGAVGATDSSDATTKLTQGYSDYESMATIVENNADVVDSSQLSLEPAITSQRTTAWNGSVVHIFTVTFQAQTLTNASGVQTNLTAADHARAFFNAGGEIWLEASRTGGSSTQKNTDWSTILSNAGTIKFGKLDTTSTGTAQTSNVGFFDLTTSYQQLSTKTGSQAEYVENDYTISALRNSTSDRITFRVEFNDDDTGDQTGIGPAVDEDVDGTLTSTIRQNRPSGSNVNVIAPLFANTSNL